MNRLKALWAKFLRGEIKTSLLIAGMRFTTLGIKFVLTLFIAHQLGLEALGLYGLIAGVTIILPTLASMGLMSLVAREMVTQTLPELTRTMRHYANMVAAFYGAVLLPVALAVGIYTDHLWLSLATFVLTVFEHANNDAFSVLINRKRPLLANVLFFIRAGGWMFVFIPVAFFVPEMASIPALMGFWFAALVVSSSAFVYFTKSWPWLERGNENIKDSLLWFKSYGPRGVKFLLSDMSNAGGQYADRYLITAFLGLQFTGIYVLFWSISNAVYNLVNTGTLQINRPHLIEARHKGDEMAFKAVFRKMTIGSLGMAAGLGLAGALVFPYLLPFLERPQAESYMPVLWILLVSLMIRTGFDLLGNLLYATGRDRPLVATTMSVLPLTVVTNLLLLPVLGIYGAALAAVVTQSCVLLARISVIKYAAWRTAQLTK